MSLEKQKIITQLKPHSRKIITQAEKIKEKVDNWLIIDQAPKRQLIEWITIDWKYSKDLDDWIWAEKTKNWYSVFISISDVSEYITPNTLLDLQAKRKTTSIYLNTHVYHMFPQILSTDIFSLNWEKNTLTQTLRVDLNNNFKIINSQHFETTFYNQKRYSYEEFNEDFQNPESVNYKLINLLHLISQWLKHNRINSWWNAHFREYVTLKLDKECNKNKQLNIGQDIISELALLRNIESAKLAYKEKIAIIYRWYRPELENKITWNLPSNKWFFNFKPTYHAWLKQNFYTYDTSPIRRYSDLITQRQIKAKLRKQEGIYNLSQIRKIAYDLNTSIDKILNLQRQHNYQVNIKRSERLLKKLEQDKFKNIWTIAEKTFFYLTKYLIEYKPYLFNYWPIKEEYIYRIKNNYLNTKNIAIIRSAPNNIIELEDIKALFLQNSFEELY